MFSYGLGTPVGVEGGGVDERYAERAWLRRPLTDASGLKGAGQGFE